MEGAHRHHESQLRNEANIRLKTNDNDEGIEANQEMIVISYIHFTFSLDSSGKELLFGRGL